MGYFTRSRALTTLDDPYDADTWNGNLGIPSKNAMRDKIETLAALADLGTIASEDVDSLVLTGAPTITLPSAVGVLQRFSVLDGQAGDFYIGLQNYDGPGATPNDRRNHVFSWGYNLGSVGRLNTSEHGYAETIESHYATVQGVEGLIEHYWSYCNAAGDLFRPWFHDINLVTDAYTGRFSGDRLVFDNYDLDFPWLTLERAEGPDSGSMSFQHNSWINYAGTVTDFILKSGVGGFLGASGSGASAIARLGSSFKNFDFGPDYDTAVDNFTFRVGGAGGNAAKSFRFTGAAATKRWEFSNDGTNYLPFEQVPSNSPWVTITQGTLGATAGNYLELGSVSATFGYNAIIVVELISGWATVHPSVQSYTIVFDYGDFNGTTSWQECVPTYGTNTDNGVALDIRNNSPSGTKTLRLRRTSTSSGTTSHNAVIRIVGREVFTESQSSGSGATVANIFRGTPARQENGRLKVELNLSLGTQTELTIASGAVTKIRSFHTIDTEGDAASDNLDTISGGAEGDILTIKAVTGARVVTVRDSVGNIILEGDCVLNSNWDTLTLIHDGTNWIELARSNNATGTGT